MSVADVVQNIRLVRSCQVAITTVVVYDHLFALDSEIELIWQKRWTSSKILYLCNRYTGYLIIFSLAAVYLDPNPTPKFCQIGVIFLQWFTAAIIWSTQLILQYRIFAMYKRSKTVLIVVASCFAVEFVLMVWLVMANQIIFRGVVLSAPRDKICAITHVLPYKWAYWVPVIAFEFLLFILALRIFLQDVVEVCQMRRWHRVSLLNLLLRDNVIYFSLALVTYSATLIVWMTCPPTWWQVPAFFSFNGTTILGCRLILNLTKAYYDQPSMGVSPWESTWVVRSPMENEPSIDNPSQGP